MSPRTSVTTNLPRLAASILLLLLAFAFAGATDLSGVGATFPFPIYSKWFDVYGKTPHGAQINYQSIGSGGGINQLKAMTVDFGASDAPLSDEEATAMPAPVAHIPTVAGAIVMSYNLPGVATGLRLSGEVIADLYLGKITKWNDPRIMALNPKIHLPNMAVAIAHRSDGSGTTYIYTHYLAAVSSEWATKVGSGKSVNWPVGLGGKGNEGVAGIVTQTSGSIGYVELAYAVQNKLHYAVVRNKAGKFIEPTIASTTAAAAATSVINAMKKDVRVSIVNSSGKDAYPIVGFTYILLYKAQPDQAKGQTLVNFLWWAIHDGQSYTNALLYAPLPAQVVKLNEAALRTITYGGRALHK